MPVRTTPRPAGPPLFGPPLFSPHGVPVDRGAFHLVEAPDSPTPER